jgi:hypothetical protein
LALAGCLAFAFGAGFRFAATLALDFFAGFFAAFFAGFLARAFAASRSSDSAAPLPARSVASSRCVTSSMSPSACTVRMRPV